MQVKMPANGRAHHGHMVCTIIPIHSAVDSAHAAAAAALQPTKLLGDPQRVHPVLCALETDVRAHLPGIGPTPRWLRELRLGEGEAHALIAPGLGHDSLESAEIAFDTLRRLLPDTDIYVSAAQA
jgi:hypothetical protein